MSRTNDIDVYTERFTYQCHIKMWYVYIRRASHLEISHQNPLEVHSHTHITWNCNVYTSIYFQWSQAAYWDLTGHFFHSYTPIIMKMYSFVYIYVVPGGLLGPYWTLLSFVYTYSNENVFIRIHRLHVFIRIHLL